MTARAVTPDILLLNANTDSDMTERMVDRARRLYPHCRGATVTEGARYISDAASLRAAAQAVTQFAEGLTREQRPDALIVACFGDPAVRELRARLPCAVVGLAEAACETACEIGSRFAIVTGGRNWPPLLHDLVSEIGLEDRLTGIYALEQTGDDIARNPSGARDTLKTAILQAQDDGADVVILGGAGLTGFAQELQTGVNIPLLDSVDCAVRRATALTRQIAEN